MEKLPVLAVLLAANVTCARTEDVEVKVAVTPAGRPLAEKVTGLLNPFCGAMEILSTAVEPRVTVTALEPTDSVNVGTVMVRVIEAEALSEPEVALMVIG